MTEKQAILLVDSYKMYQVRLNDVLLTDIGERFGVTPENARYRIKKIRTYIANGELEEKLKEANAILASCKGYAPYGYSYCERRPVRTSSGARFTPL